MPVLDNPRHERFAQEMAKGSSATEAYEAAGYRPSRSAAARLSANVGVCARLTELQTDIAERTVQNVSKTRADVVSELAKIGFVAVAEASVKASDKRAALLNLAQIEGWVVERHEHTGKGGGPIQTLDLSNLSDEQLDQLEAIFGPVAIATSRSGDGADQGRAPSEGGDTQH